LVRVLVTISINPELLEKAKRRAKEEGISLSALITMLLNKWLSSYEEEAGGSPPAVEEKVEARAQAQRKNVPPPPCNGCEFNLGGQCTKYDMPITKAPCPEAQEYLKRYFRLP